MDERLGWLLDSDPSVELQVRRDLLHEEGPALEVLSGTIGQRGWAHDLLAMRLPSGHWGKDAYCPKWTCTHYVLGELAQLEMPRDDAKCRESCLILLGYPTGKDGGVNYAKTVDYADVCVNGALLALGSWFLRGDARLLPVLDYLLDIRMPDGGWNCEYREGATHSSLHTTLAALEGLQAWLDEGVRHRRAEVVGALAAGREFILRHRLFRSERTGEVIKDEFFRFCFPVRYKYDILRCLDSFRKAGLAYDPRMDEALAIVAGACDATGRWKAQVQSGKTYFDMEKPGRAGRWNTLRALRILEYYGK